MPAINYKFKFTFSSASISSVLLPAAQMRNTNPNFSLYRAFHSDSSCKIDHMQMTNCHSSTINIAVEAFFLWPHVCCLIQSPILLMDKWLLINFVHNNNKTNRQIVNHDAGPTNEGSFQFNILHISLSTLSA